MEKVLWLIKVVKSGLQSFLVLLTFWANNSLPWAVSCMGRCLAAPLASTHQKPIAGESQHTQNIQINKVIGGNEKGAFILQKNATDFLANPTLHRWRVGKSLLPQNSGGQSSRSPTPGQVLKAIQEQVLGEHLEHLGAFSHLPPFLTVWKTLFSSLHTWSCRLQTCDSEARLPNWVHPLSSSIYREVSTTCEDIFPSINYTGEIEPCNNSTTTGFHMWDMYAKDFISYEARNDLFQQIWLSQTGWVQHSKELLRY